MMDTPASAAPRRREGGGFRRSVDTELGEELFCSSCQEFWPPDKEFFIVKANRVSYECKACIADRKLLADFQKQKNLAERVSK